MRQLSIPEQLKLCYQESELSEAINKIAQGYDKVLLICGARSSKLLPKDLRSDIKLIKLEQNCINKINQHNIINIIDLSDISSMQSLQNEDKGSRISVNRLRVNESSSVVEDLPPGLVIGFGGGRTLDIAKLYAAKTSSKFISIPSLISHDGICSPVAVVAGESLAAIMPDSIIAPIYLIQKAELKYIQAGIGDVLANFSAIEDWRLAATNTDEELDDFAIILAKQAAQNILESLEIISHQANPEIELKSEKFLVSLVEALMLSGIAMSISGNSRPCSGAEHLISHAIDQIFGHGVKSSHGLQVLVATIYLQELRGATLSISNESLTQILSRLNFPTKFEDIGISQDELTKIIELAPSTRKRRYTILDSRSKIKI